MLCERCGNEFFDDWRRDKEQRKKVQRFCSRSCANSRTQTKEMNNKKSDKLHKLYGTVKKICKVCGDTLNSTNRSGFCKKCKPVSPKKSQRETQKDYRKKRKQDLINYKGGKCKKCGYNRCIEALEFHHRNPKEKKYALSSTKSGRIFTFEQDKIEADKCDLLCSNCHREVHSFRKLVVISGKSD